MVPFNENSMSVLAILLPAPHSVLCLQHGKFSRTPNESLVLKDMLTIKKPYHAQGLGPRTINPITKDSTKRFL